MSAFLPELIVTGLAAVVVGVLTLYIRRESAKLDREQGR
jgi:hypothetical protein